MTVHPAGLESRSNHVALSSAQNRPAWSRRPPPRGMPETATRRTAGFDTLPYACARNRHTPSRRAGGARLREAQETAALRRRYAARRPGDDHRTQPEAGRQFFRQRNALHHSGRRGTQDQGNVGYSAQSGRMRACASIACMRTSCSATAMPGIGNSPASVQEARWLIKKCAAARRYILRVSQAIVDRQRHSSSTEKLQCGRSCCARSLIRSSCTNPRYRA